MTDQHTCPRRAETGRDNPNSPFVGSGTDLDTWRASPTGPSCSYCGSLHPDRFMDLVREGWSVGPTDKNYKAYLRRTPTAEDIAGAKSRWLEHSTIARVVREVGERGGKTARQIQADLDERWSQEPPPVVGPEAKFYFQHLSREQRDEFIGLYNSKQMRVGYPGHFYQPPFFARAAAE